MSGWIQKYLGSSDGGAGAGVAQQITVASSALELAAGVNEPRGLWLKVYAAYYGGETDMMSVAVEGSIDNGFGANGRLYGVLEIPRSFAGEAGYESDPENPGFYRLTEPHDIPLWTERTLHDDTPPTPPYSAGNGTMDFGTLTITQMAVLFSEETNFWLEWWENMVNTFASKVKDEVEGGSWATAGSTPPAVLVLNEDLDRHDVKELLDTALVVVHSPTDETPAEGREGGHGRERRRITCHVTVCIKDASGMDSEEEETPLQTLENHMTDLKAIFRPAGIPNRLGGYVVDLLWEPVGAPFSLESEGVDALARTVKLIGLKHEVA